MSQQEKKMQEIRVGRKSGGDGGRNGGDGRDASSGRHPWYLAQGAGSGLKYVLTGSGYVTL